MTLNMNTIPKLKIKVIELKNEVDIKHYFFDKEYSKRRNIYWSNKNIELIGIDLLVSSDFSCKQEYEDLSLYYNSIINNNKSNFDNLDIPTIFVGACFNFNENTQDNLWTDIPKGRIFIPKILIIDNKTIKRIVTFESEGTINDANILNTFNYKQKSLNIKFVDETDANHYISSITKSIKLIKDKKLSKIVLSRKKSYSINSKDDALSNFIFNTGEDNTTKFVFDFQESGTIFGSSPEKLFSISNNHFKTEAIAGSFKSTSNLNLIDKNKEIDEHNFVIDYLKSKLSNFSKKIKIYDNEILALRNISHIKTKIESTLEQEHNVFDILFQLHPTPAVAGTPKDVSIDKISNLENHDRGWYSGTIGWISNELNTHFIVNIRSGIIKKNQLNIYAGCGITKGSDPNQEYDESEMKFDYILSNLNHE
tara:strand:- start:6279 stop:7547 length:1269 start_codon:yes stop_codon:yes gene_type:complete